MTNETIHCEICGEQPQKMWFPDHVIRNHDESPVAVRQEYPELYRSFATVVDEEFGSFQELLDIVKSNSEYVSAVREEFLGAELSEPPDGQRPDSDSTSSDSDSTGSTHSDDENQSGTDDEPAQSLTEEPGSGRANSGQQSTTSTGSTGDQQPPDRRSTAPSDTSTGDTPRQTRETEPEPKNTDSNGLAGEFSLQNKWFFVGIGGCGGNLIDSALLRTNALIREDERRAQLWQQGLTDVTVLNTNEGELGPTFFAREYVDQSPSAVANDYLIGNGGGAGTDPMTGREKWNNEYEDNGDTLFKGHYRKLEDIDVSEGVMVFHSVVKGTGTGVSSLFTKHLKADKLSNGRVFHFTVLPNPGEITDLTKRVNALFGTVTVAQQAEAMIIVDNANLAASDVTVELADYDDEKSGYKEENQTALALLEALTVSSVVPGGNEEAIASGDMFDIEDAYKPITRLYSDNEGPAPVIAPAIKERETPIETETQLQKFVQSTLETGRLTDFDPETAWGGSFLFYGPKSEIDQIRSITNQNITPILHDGVSIDFEFTGIHPGPVKEYYVDVDGMESTRLCALMWNPKLERLRETREYYEQWQHKLGTTAEFLGEREDKIDELFRFLGAEWFNE